LMSVPGLIATNARSIPSDVPYLSVDETRRAQVAKDLAPTPAGLRKVGIAWAGARNNAMDRRRSCALATLKPLLEVRGVRWFSLQLDAEEEVASLPDDLRPALIDARNDLDGTSALVAELDLVVTVDTSIAHLAGALGRPAWVMLPFAPDWRWGL